MTDDDREVVLQFFFKMIIKHIFMIIYGNKNRSMNSTDFCTRLGIFLCFRRSRSCAASQISSGAEIGTGRTRRTAIVALPGGRRD